MAKNIEFNVLINDGQASSKFATLDRSVDNLGKTANKTGQNINNFSRRDLGLFATQALHTINISGTLGSQLSNLATGLATGGVIGAGFAAGAALINAFAEAFKDLGEEAKKAEEKMRPAWEKFERVMNVKATPGTLLEKWQNILKPLQESIWAGREEGLVKRLKDQIDNYTDLRDNVAKTREEFEKYDSIIKQLEKTLETFFSKDKGGILGRLNNEIKIKGELLLQANSLSEIKQLLKDINALELQRKSIISPLPMPRARGFDWTNEQRQRWLGRGMFSREQGESPLKNIMPSREELDKAFGDLKDIAFSSAEVIRSEFITLWQDIFGEANSLMEKFFLNIFDWLSRLAARSFGEWLFSSVVSLIPGLGGAAGAAMALGKTAQPIVIQLGDKTLAELVVQGNRVAVNRRIGY